MLETSCIKIQFSLNNQKKVAPNLPLPLIKKNFNINPDNAEKKKNIAEIIFTIALNFILFIFNNFLLELHNKIEDVYKQDILQELLFLHEHNHNFYISILQLFLF